MFNSVWKLLGKSPPRTNHRDSTSAVTTSSPLPSFQQSVPSPYRQSPDQKKRNTNPSPGNSNRVLHGLIGGSRTTTTNKYPSQHVKSVDNDITIDEPPIIIHSTTTMHVNDSMIFPPPHQNTNMCNPRTMEQVAITSATLLNEYGLQMPDLMPMGPCLTAEELHERINRWAKYRDESFSVKKTVPNQALDSVDVHSYSCVAVEGLAVQNQMQVLVQVIMSMGLVEQDNNDNQNSKVQ